jgi:hypothetical protein
MSDVIIEIDPEKTVVEALKNAWLKKMSTEWLSSRHRKPEGNPSESYRPRT